MKKEKVVKKVVPSKSSYSGGSRPVNGAKAVPKSSYKK